MRDPFASFFGNDHLLNRIHLPQIFPFVNGGPLELKEGKLQQQEKEAKDQIEPRSLFGGTNFGNMFSHIHSIMESVLQKFKSGELGGHGKLVVIKAGPGHYETETYDLSPQNANEHNNNMNDMSKSEDHMGISFMSLLGGIVCVKRDVGNAHWTN
ncbi:Uncharacterized protein FKW44_018381 [Caligus rogercresseyi]|uniref:Uncharacterized protein n=1 Tax=Caligus rogercresseyi TaxID=217165 RepID=A0A7T8GUB5_CALRO|nr:Uncharacterized protein FKW44_018381 [Caligus rogercresseyi]